MAELPLPLQILHRLFVRRVSPVGLQILRESNRASRRQVVGPNRVDEVHPHSGERSSGITGSVIPAGPAWPPPPYRGRGPALSPLWVQEFNLCIRYAVRFRSSGKTCRVSPREPSPAPVQIGKFLPAPALQTENREPQTENRIPPAPVPGRNG